MKIQMRMKYDILLYNDDMQYVTLHARENQIINVTSVEKYSGKYTHMNTTDLYTITFSSGRYAHLSDSVFKVVDE